MTIPEFSNNFDLLYNNVTSNQAPGLNEWEKSVFLTQAEKEIVKNYFTANSKGNNIGQGFDDSAKRQADFSVLMKTSNCSPATISGSQTVTVRTYSCTSGGITKVMKSSELVFTPSVQGGTVNLVADTEYTVDGELGSFGIGSGVNRILISEWPYEGGGTLTPRDNTYTNTFGLIDDRSSTYMFPDDVYIIVNETIKTSTNKYLQVIPLRYDEYTRLMSKPFKYPLKNQVWRLMNSGMVSESKGVKFAEIIANSADKDNITLYNVRYVRVPKPIILADISPLTIDGESTPSSVCEIDPILHEDILQRAVELAKIAWTQTGQDNTQMVIQAGQRSE